MIDNIDWSKLRTYGVDKYRSFEELCYQLAKRLYGPNGLYGDMGEFTSIDDSGGGDGVEFYLTLPDGEEWGWQAKFYYPDERLNESNRKTQITTSLKTACAKHPRLKKWFLCTPTNFSVDKKAGARLLTGEDTWFRETLAKEIPEGMELALLHWGNSDFLEWLGRIEFVGLRHYFFGELELNLQWFRTQVEKQLESLGAKYESDLHTPTSLDLKVHRLLGDVTFVDELTRDFTFISTQSELLDQAQGKFEAHTAPGVEWAGVKVKLSGWLQLLQHTFSKALTEIEKARNLLNEHRVKETAKIEWGPLRALVNNAYSDYSSALRAVSWEVVAYDREPKKNDDLIRDLRFAAWQPNQVAEILLDRLNSVIDDLVALKETDLHILGKAGAGKSHLAANICSLRLKVGLPALLLRGVQFTSEAPLTRQLLDILDIPRVSSWTDFLQALSIAADVYRVRIPIVIDGLNEAANGGRFTPMWANQLPGLVSEMRDLKSLVLVTTCRDSYRAEIWPDGGPRNVEFAYGFDDVELAVSKYFRAYKIVADLTAVPLQQFQHPIYLRIFCETVNPTRLQEKRVYIGEHSLFEVFDKYLKEANNSVCRHLQLHPKADIVVPALRKIAGHMWREHTRAISPDALILLVDGQPLDELRDWNASKTKAIESEGILLYRDIYNGEEAVFFTFDLLAGYMVAKQLIDEHRLDLAAFVSSDLVTTSLFDSRSGRLHPLYSDIRRCLAALLATEAGVYLHELTNNGTAVRVSIEALFEISPNAISRSCVQLIERLFSVPERRRSLLNLSSFTVGHVGHPLNARFWSEQLRLLTIPERDLSWTENVRENTVWFEKLIAQVEEACQSAEHRQISPIQESRLALLAEHIMWILASTIKALRDKATRSLYWFGRRWPRKFLELLIYSFRINDPYVSERMLAAAYGVVMARQYDFEQSSFADEELPEYGRSVYDAMFRSEAPYSTTHILSRDYARRIIEVALLHSPGLLGEGEKALITPPFQYGGIRDWGQLADRNPGEYRDGNHPMMPYSQDEPIGWLGPEVSKYHPESPAYKKAEGNLWWRVYGLGYSLEQFGDIDRNIALRNQFRGRGTEDYHANTYGEKYTLIAAHELVGYRDDLGLIKRDYEDEAEHRRERWHDVDIDPSFPAEPSDEQIVHDILGDRSLSIEEWIVNGDDPDLKPYLELQELCNVAGPWVLLSVGLNQTEDSTNRSIYTRVHSFILAVADSASFVQTMLQRDQEHDLLDSLPMNHYTFAGEIPWADTYPPNGVFNLHIPVNARTVTSSQEDIVLYRDGIRLGDGDFDEALNAIIDATDQGTEAEQELLLGEALLEHRLSLDIEVTSIERKDYDYQTHSVSHTVRSDNWEGYHSPILPGRDIATPSREITDHLGLCSQPQTYNLYEKDGHLASISLRNSEQYLNAQKLTYLRKDLLDRFLLETNSAMVWVISGSRQYSATDHEFRQLPDSFVQRKDFEQVVVYEP